LFAQAERAGDYSGAASVARVLRDFDRDPPPAAPGVDPDFLDYLTVAEANELDHLFERMDALQLASKSRRHQPRPTKYYDESAKVWVERLPTLEERKARHRQAQPESEPVAPPPPPKWSHVELDEDEYIEEDTVYRRDPVTGVVEWVEDLEENPNEGE